MGRFAAADHVVAQRKDHGSPWQLPEEAKRPTRTADQRPDSLPQEAKPAGILSDTVAAALIIIFRLGLDTSGGVIRARRLIDCNQARRFSRHAFAICRCRIDVRLRRARPVVERHQLSICCPVLCCHGCAGLAQPVSTALRQTGLVTALPKPIANPEVKAAYQRSQNHPELF